MSAQSLVHVKYEVQENKELKKHFFKQKKSVSFDSNILELSDKDQASLKQIKDPINKQYFKDFIQENKLGLNLIEQVIDDNLIKK